MFQKHDALSEYLLLLFSVFWYSVNNAPLFHKLLQSYRSSRLEVFFKKMFLEISQNS